MTIFNVTLNIRIKSVPLKKSKSSIPSISIDVLDLAYSAGFRGIFDELSLSFP